MESRNLYEDDLTDERKPSPVQIEEASHQVRLDPDVDDSGAEEPVAGTDDVDDDDDDDDDLEDEEDFAADIDDDD